jgi:hypothetical protein
MSPGLSSDQGSAKWLSNQLKRKQKTKIRWYCGLCHVGCKDENGYKNHIESESHVRRELTVGGDSGKKEFTMSSEDKKFQKKFVNVLITKHFGQTVLSHEAYRDLYPLDRGHNVMKGTCWGTLGVFIAHLRRCGLIEAQKGIKGWQIRVSSELHLESDDGSDDESVEREAEEEAVKPKLESSIKKARINEANLESHSEATNRIDTTKVKFSFGVKDTTSKGPASSNIPSAFGEGESE